MQRVEETPQSAAGAPAEVPVPAVQVYQGTWLVGSYQLTDAGLTIGKASGNDLVIKRAHISKQHARIVGEPGCWSIEDLGSTNGTFVYEGERLVYSSSLHAGPWVLQDQQEIRLGPHPDELRLVFSDPTNTDKSPPLSFDEPRREVWVRGHPVRLPRDHYAILLALYQRAPYPCSYEDLAAVLDQDRQTRKRPTYTARAVSEVDSLHHLIHRLRARIEVNPRQPQLILQVPHVGYRLYNAGTAFPQGASLELQEE